MKPPVIPPTAFAPETEPLFPDTLNLKRYKAHTLKITWLIKLCKQTPQMIIITFDDAVNPDNMNIYTDWLFPKNRTNPNGCPWRATYFISHEYTHYQQVQMLWNQGHEIAVHSIT